MDGHGRTLVVTGGGRGIGAAVARSAAQRGWDVAISYRRRHADAQQVVEECRRFGVRAVAVRADITQESEVRHLFQSAAAQLPGPIQGLVNNAGAVAPLQRLEDFTARRIRDVFEVNLTGAFLCAREAVLVMSTHRRGRGGVIVNVSSRAAVLGSPGEYIDYAAAKAGVDTLTVGLAKEVAADGIRVVGVRPGLIDTELHAPGRLDRLGSTPPVGRPGKPEEVAAAVVWLLSEEASYVTGAVLDVSGGR